MWLPVCICISAVYVCVCDERLLSEGQSAEAPSSLQYTCYKCFPLGILGRAALIGLAEQTLQKLRAHCCKHTARRGLAAVCSPFAPRWNKSNVKRCRIKAEPPDMIHIHIAKLKYLHVQINHLWKHQGWGLINKMLDALFLLNPVFIDPPFILSSHSFLFPNQIRSIQTSKHVSPGQDIDWTSLWMMLTLSLCTV